VPRLRVPILRRGEQSPKEKGKLVSCQSLGLSQQPPIFNSIANDICDQRPEPLEELRRTAWWPQFSLMICKQERTFDMKDSLNSTRIAINQL